MFRSLCSHIMNLLRLVSFGIVLLLVLCPSPYCAAQSTGGLASKLKRLKAARSQQPATDQAAVRNPTYDRMLKSVALLRMESDDEVSMGTGWVVDAEQKLMVTNHHVVEYYLDCDVYFPKYDNGRLDTDPETGLDDSRLMYGRVIDVDASVDLALIQLEGDLPEGIVALELADQSATPGSTIHSLAGSTIGSQSLWIYSTGHVRQIVQGELANGYETRVLESDMATNQGNSGGPVCNDQGQVVAVVEGHKTNARLVSMYVELQPLVEYLSQALRTVDPQTVEDLQFTAQRLLNDGRRQEALEKITRAISMKDDDPQLITFRGWCWYWSDDTESAKADFEDALKLDSKFANAYYGLGTLAKEDGQNEEAIKHFTNAIRNDPGTAEYLVDRGACQIALGNKDKGRRDIESGLSINPDYTEGILEMIYLETDEGSYASALARMDTVIGDVLDNQRAVFHAGYLMTIQDNYKAARSYFAHLIQLNPEYLWGHYYLGQSLNRLNEHGEALSVLAVEFERHPEDADVAFERSLALIGLGKIAAGVQEASRARKLAPKNDTIKNHFDSLRAEHPNHFSSIAAPVTQVSRGNRNAGNPAVPQKFVGTWVSTMRIQGGSIVTELTLAADATYSVRTSMTDPSGQNKVDVSNGTFTLDSKTLITTSAETGLPKNRPIRWQGQFLSMHINEGNLSGWVLFSKKR